MRISPKLVQNLRGIGLSRERLPLVFALLDAAFDPLRDPQTFDRFYREQPDPWKYASDIGEGDRYRLATALLDGLLADRRCFESVVEIGCSEGAFTEVLAPRTQALLAVDFSTVALGRARQRRRWGPGAKFDRYDLRLDPPLGSFELVVVMDVLSSFRRPGALRNARDKLASCVRPGGYLLVTDHRQHPVFESAWWARRLIRGGQQVVSAFAQHPALTQLDGCRTDTHVLALFTRREDSPQ